MSWEYMPRIDERGRSVVYLTDAYMRYAREKGIRIWDMGRTDRSLALLNEVIAAGEEILRRVKP